MKKLSEYNFDQLQVGMIVYNPHTKNKIEIIEKDFENNLSVWYKHLSKDYVNAWYHYSDNIPEHLYVLEEGEIV